MATNTEAPIGTEEKSATTRKTMTFISDTQQKEADFLTLRKTIDRLDFDFYKELLPQILQWASEHAEKSWSMEALHAGSTAKITCTSHQIRYVLANAFLLNVTPGYGTLDLFHLYNSLDSLALERIRCLIEYFRLSAQQDDQREISIERYTYGDELPNWNEQNILIQASKVNVFTDRMENAETAKGFVDFANRRIHIHRIIASATQEEVLFSCCPEAFVSILLCETLEDDEIIILRGCKRFIDYTGYGDTFRYKGPYHNQNPDYIQDIIVIDACYCQQFQEKILNRDLNKAWAGFSKSNDDSIVTGHWGCGVFGGDYYLKFLQQVCATVILGSQMQRLDYSVYGDDQLANGFRTLLKRLEEKQKTVADVYQMMVNYHDTSMVGKSSIGFYDYLNRWLDSASNA